MEYLKFYQLEREPFQNDPDRDFYYESAMHRRARLLLLRGVQQRKALSVLIGGPGCGKTTLATHIFESLGAGDFEARLLSISHADCAQGWLLPQVARAFGVDRPASSAPSQLEQIHEALVSCLVKGRYPVLLVDEAQLLSNAEVMEELRGLLNLVHEGRKALSLLLFGLPELSNILKLDEPLAQRVEIRAEVVGLGEDEVKSYVKHRLQAAGSTEEVFSEEALQALCTYTGGVPRLVNTLADNALFEGMLSESNPADGSLVAAAAEQLELKPVQSRDAIVSAPLSMLPDLGDIDGEDSFALGDDSGSDGDPKPRGAPAADALAELDLEPLEEPADSAADDDSQGESYSDFSMGSLVRDADADEPASEPELDIPVLDEIEPEPVQTADAEAVLLNDEEDDEIELELDAEDEIELEAAAPPVAEPEVESSSGFDLGAELLEDADADEEVLGADSGSFDPGELLVELEDDEPSGSTPAPAPTYAPKSEDEPAEDLDDLFESIQVGD